MVNVNEFLKVADEIIKPTCNLTPVAFNLDKRGIESKKGHCALYNFQTGKIEYMQCDSITNNAHVCVDICNTSKTLENVYFEYLPKYNATAICLVNFDSSDYEIGEKREFQTVNHYFITEDKYFVYKKDGIWVSKNDEDVINNELPFSYFLEPISKSNIREELAKQYGVFKSGNKYKIIDNASALSDYMFKTSLSVEEQAKTKEVNEIIQKTLELKLSPIIVNNEHMLCGYNYAKLEYVNPEVSVIRWFTYVSDSQCLEYLRYYITDEINFSCTIENNGKTYAFTNLIDIKQMFISGLICDKEELKGSKFECFFDLIEKSLSIEKVATIYNLIEFELLGKIAKTGFNCFTDYVLMRYRFYDEVPYNVISRIFSTKFSDDETDIYKALGVNEHQFQKIAQSFKIFARAESLELEETISSIRVLLKGDKCASISDVDNTTFDKLFDVIININRAIWDFIPTWIENAVKICSVDCIYDMLSAMLVLYEDSLLSGEDIRYMFIDYIYMLTGLNDSKSFSLKFKHLEDSQKLYEEFNEAYDTVTDAYNSI